MKNTLLIIFFIIGLNYSIKVFAVDGVIEINHTCATQLGCFSGDTLGYPISINGTAGKSYRLTSDLIIPDENTDGINVSSNDINIDLNGFSIMGITCVGVTTDCTPASGSGDGITMNLTAIQGFKVKDGSINGMGKSGLNIIGSQATIDNINARWNASSGITIRGNTTVKNCTVSNNVTGISSGAGNNNIITNNIISFNSSTGISLSSDSIITHNSVFSNGASGISTSSSSYIAHNVSTNNSIHGISSSGKTIVENNTSTLNGGNGIHMASFDGGSVRNNTVHSNTGFGLRFFSANNPYSGNTIINNTGGTVNQGFDMGDNFCESDKVCP